MGRKIMISFPGHAIGEIGGSAIRLDVDNESFLFDNGIKQKKRYRAFIKANSDTAFGLDGRGINAVILTHSHADHNGKLPFMVKHGYGGPIFCTPETAEISGITLSRAANMIVEDWHRERKRERMMAKGAMKVLHNKHGRKDRLRNNCNQKKKISQFRRDHVLSIKELEEPFYSLADVSATDLLYQRMQYEHWLDIGNQVSLKFYQAGHILGSAISVIRIRDGSDETFIGFSGDMGREDNVLLSPPSLIKEPISYWITESTYGDRDHPPRNEEERRLIDEIKINFSIGGKMLIPTFTLERAQEIIYLLSKWMSQELIPFAPIYLDSPQSIEITKTFARAWDRKMFSCNGINFNPFTIETNPYLRLVVSREKSGELITRKGPHFVIAGSGMCDNGRIRHHIEANVGNSCASVCLTGYMNPDSLGYKLIEVPRGMPFHFGKNKETVKLCKVFHVDFSGHAGKILLMKYVEELHARNLLKKIFLVHGNLESAISLKTALNESLKISEKNIIIPELGKSFKLV